MANTTYNTTVKAGTKFREYYREHKGLGGLIRWKTVARLDKLGDEVHITSQKPVKVFLNGKELLIGGK